MASGDTRTQQYLGIAANGNRADLPGETCCETRTQTLTREVAERVIGLDEEVQELKNNPDVVDIVGTYADLQAYDTSRLTDKDVIRVLQDETHNGDSTYYRWDATAQEWSYIGESKQYTDFVGTDGTSAGESGLVPAPTTSDAGKFLKSDGTWDTAGGGGPTVVQTTGTSTTDVMSQNATTSMVFDDPATQRKVKIGASTFTPVGNDAIEIGKESKAKGNSTIAIGSGAMVDSFAGHGVAIGTSTKTFGDNAITIGYIANASGEKAVALGRSAQTNHSFAVALGAGATTSAAGEINVGTGSTYPTKGYNGTNYRLISGVHDGQNAHDAVTVNQVNSVIDAINTALSTNIPHIGA